jgi:bifunctional ADP-heptose synthase (sugar kinase/adenylyltransferase)
LSLAAGDSPLQAAYLGNAAAAIEVGRLGNHPVAAAALRDWLAVRPELPRKSDIAQPICT